MRSDIVSNAPPFGSKCTPSFKISPFCLRYYNTYMAQCSTYFVTIWQRPLATIKPTPPSTGSEAVSDDLVILILRGNCCHFLCYQCFWAIHGGKNSRFADLFADILSLPPVFPPADKIKKHRKPLFFGAFHLVDDTGLEPVTLRTSSGCSSS